MSLIITTNRHWREFTSWDELTAEEQAFHDYADGSDLFIRYRGCIEHAGSFMRVPVDGALHVAGWDGAMAHGLWTGLLLRVGTDAQFQIGFYREVS